MQGFNYMDYAAFNHQSINFYGVWADFKKIPRQIKLATYLMYFENGNPGPTGGGDGEPELSTARRAFYTLGVRANKDAEIGKNGFVWNAEVAMQDGDFQRTDTEFGDNGSISAMAFELMLGYNLNAGGSDHLFQGKYVQASGNKYDKKPDKAEAFDPLFQDYHMRYGLSDIFTLSDLTAMSVGWNMTKGNHILGLDYWMYDLSENIIDARDKKISSLGSEVDAWYKFQYTPNTQIMAGLAYFMPGDVIKYEYDPAGGPTDAGLRLVTNLRLRF
jgi:hypothetical protein